MPRGLSLAVKPQRAGVWAEELFCSLAGVVMKWWRYPKGLAVLLNYAASTISPAGFGLKSILQA